MIGDRDQPDPNPYQSPAWPLDDEQVGGEHGTGMLTAPIHIKGSLSLDDVLRAYPGLIRRAWELIPWCFLLSVLGLMIGLGCLIIVRQAVYHRQPVSFVLVVFFVSSGLAPLGAFLRQILAGYWIRRLWKKQSSIFQCREMTITDELISTTSAHGDAKTPWTDYASYRSDRETIWLYLGRQGLKRRREQCGTDERQSRFGINLRQADIFPRLQFDDHGDWERFQWAVKHKLKKKP